MSLEIYLPSLAKTGYDIFNAIAIFFNSDAWRTLYTTGIGLGFIMATIQYIHKKDHTIVYKWVTAVVLVPLFLFTYKGTVVIRDISSPLNAYTVDNVPSGIALPASLITKFVFGTQEAIADIFHTVNQSDYSNTGMTYTANLFKETTQVYPTGQTQRLFDGYVQNCMLPDVTTRSEKTYTWGEVYAAPNIIEFLNKRASPGEFDQVAIKPGKFISCNKALELLTRGFKDNAENAKLQIANSLKSETQNKVIDTDNLIENVYTGYFRQNSADATTILMQNMTINGLKMSFDTMSKATGMSSGMNYALTQARSNTIASYATLGILATEFIPMINTILLLLMLCMFIPVMLLIFMPSMTTQLLQKYFYGLFWICSWGISYVFIDFIMSSILSTNANGLFKTKPLDMRGFSLSMQDPLDALTYKYASITGYLFMMTPFLSNIVTKGASAVMGSLATSITAQMGANVHKGVEAIASGDTSIGTTSFNMHNANKDDLSHSAVGMGLTRALNPGGTESVRLADGRTFDNKGHSIAQVGWNANDGRTLSNSLQQTKSEMISDTDQKGEALSETLSEARNHTDDKNYSVSNAMNESFDTVSSINNSYSHSDANSQVVSATVGVGGKAQFTTGDKKSISVDLNAGLNGQMTDTSGNVIDLNASERDSLSKSFTKVQTAASSESVSDQDRVAKDFVESWNNTYAKVNSANETISHLESNNYNLSTDDTMLVYNRCRELGMEDSHIASPQNSEDRALIRQAFKDVYSDNQSIQKFSSTDYVSNQEPAIQNSSELKQEGARLDPDIITKMTLGVNTRVSNADQGIQSHMKNNINNFGNKIDNFEDRYDSTKDELIKQNQEAASPSSWWGKITDASVAYLSAGSVSSRGFNEVYQQRQAEREVRDTEALHKNDKYMMKDDGEFSGKDVNIKNPAESITKKFIYGETKQSQIQDSILDKIFTKPKD